MSDRNFLQQPRLLNAQTGDYVEVMTEDLGSRRFELTDNLHVSADGFRVLSADQELSVKVWYEQASGKWIALESELEGGKTLRYLPDTSAALLSDITESAPGESG